MGLDKPSTQGLLQQVEGLCPQIVLWYLQHNLPSQQEAKLCVQTVLNRNIVAVSMPP